MGGLFAPRIVPMRGIGVVEGLPVNVLSVGREMIPDRAGQIFVTAIRHFVSPSISGALSSGNRAAISLISVTAAASPGQCRFIE
jgi:hypothetical protein